MHFSAQSYCFKWIRCALWVFLKNAQTSVSMSMMCRRATSSPQVRAAFFGQLCGFSKSWSGFNRWRVRTGRKTWAQTRKDQRQKRKNDDTMCRRGSATDRNNVWSILMWTSPNSCANVQLCNGRCSRSRSDRWSGTSPRPKGRDFAKCWRKFNRILKKFAGACRILGRTGKI